MSADTRTILLRFPPGSDLGDRLALAAASRGVSRQELARVVLDAALPPAAAGKTRKAWRQLSFPGFPAVEQ